jgi:hypothetical protein
MRSKNETEIQFFGNETSWGKYQILLLHFDAFKSFSIEERPTLLDLFHHLIISDGIKKDGSQQDSRT